MKINQFSSLEDRFEAQYMKCGPNGCWQWTGAITSSGRPSIKKNYKSLNASRVAYEIFIGKIPEGMLVCHHCDNTICVNPEHLFLGTHADNMRDKVKKNRVWGGYQSGTRKTKICDLDVWLIRNCDCTNAAIARFFEISPSYVSQLRGGKRRVIREWDKSITPLDDADKYRAYMRQWKATNRGLDKRSTG